MTGAIARDKRPYIQLSVVYVMRPIRKSLKIFIRHDVAETKKNYTAIIEQQTTKRNKKYDVSTR